MSDPNIIYSGLGLQIRHSPDFSLEVDGNGETKRVELPGHVEIGVVVDNVFVPVLRRKAAGLFADIERAKKQSGSETQA